MKWHTKRGRVWRTIDGTTKARAYYWIRQDGQGIYRVGYYAFNREIERQGVVFGSLNEAKFYLKDLDDSTLVIEAVYA